METRENKRRPARIHHSWRVFLRRKHIKEGRRRSRFIGDRIESRLPVISVIFLKDKFVNFV